MIRLPHSSLSLLSFPFAFPRLAYRPSPLPSLFSRVESAQRYTHIIVYPFFVLVREPLGLGETACLEYSMIKETGKNEALRGVLFLLE